MDSTAHPSYRDSEIINELLLGVTIGFDSPNSQRESEMINEVLSRVTKDSTAQTALGTQKLSRNCCHR